MERNTEFNERIRALAERIHEGFDYISVEEARREILLWISETRQINALKLRLEPPELTEEEWSDLDNFVIRRSMGMPFAYILGRTNFYGLELAIGPGVLIPRPETEELVDRCMDWLVNRIENGASNLRILDLCAGSGCIGVAIGRSLADKMRNREIHRATLDITFSDLSGYALEYARMNGDVYAEPGLSFSAVEGDLMAPFRTSNAPPFDLIACNPPYVHPDEIPLLSPETYLHEPREALFHSNPPALYIEILKQCQAFLKPGAAMMMELSPYIHEVVKLLCEQEFPDCETRIETDLSGKSRFLIFTCK